MKWTFTEGHVYMQRHQGTKHFNVSGVIYHKFSHGVASYTLKGETVNVMLELSIYFHVNTVIANTCCDAQLSVIPC